MSYTKNYKLFFSVSGAIIIVGLILTLVLGLNLGIDFSSGTMMQVQFNQVIDHEQVKTALTAFDLDPHIISVGRDDNEIIIKTTKSLNNDQRSEVVTALKEAFDLKEVVNSELIGPSIGEELKKRAVYSVIIASLGMLLYITMRFEWKFGIAAIVALMHDVLILLAVYAIFRVEVNGSFIAAILTVVGYSINDTIVVFDRIRDNVKYAKSTNYFKIADESLGQTITRSINTSVTTLLVIGALYFIGTDAIKALAFPLLAGVLAGTYSSIFIASPVWVLLKNYAKAKQKA